MSNTFRGPIDSAFNTTKKLFSADSGENGLNAVTSNIKDGALGVAHAIGGVLSMIPIVPGIKKRN